MKKYFYLALMAIACGAMFVACSDNNPNVERCREMTSEMSVMGQSMSITTYFWGTENDLKTQIQAAEAEAKKEGMDVKISYKKASANDKDACEAKNNPYGGGNSSEEACWKITQGSPGQTFTYYSWGSEENLKLNKEIAEAQGLIFEWEKAAADDEDACMALNNQ